MGFLEYPYTNFDDMNLDYIIKTVKNLFETVSNLEEWRTTHEQEYEELKALYDDIMRGIFPDSIKTAFNVWMEKNAVDIVGNMVKHVFFGLTDYGYFCAFIPDSWDDIVFKTSEYDYVTPLMPEYGHLILQY